MSEITKEDVKLITLDGSLQWKLRCPKCKTWGNIDDDQFNGRVSMVCSECDWHETHDLSLLGLKTE